MRDRSTLGAAGFVVAALALASLAAQPRPAPAAAAKTPHPRASAATGAPHLDVLRDGGRLDLNVASATDLQLLPGIGSALARRIVDDRSRAGAYRAVDDLARVSGIGAGKLARIRALVRVADQAGGSADYLSNTSTPATTAAR